MKSHRTKDVDLISSDIKELFPNCTSYLMKAFSGSKLLYWIGSKNHAIKDFLEEQEAREYFNETFDILSHLNSLRDSKTTLKIYCISLCIDCWTLMIVKNITFRKMKLECDHSTLVNFNHVIGQWPPTINDSTYYDIFLKNIVNSKKYKAQIESRAHITRVGREVKYLTAFNLNQIVCDISCRESEIPQSKMISKLSNTLRMNYNDEFYDEIFKSMLKGSPLKKLRPQDHSTLPNKGHKNN